MKGRDFWLLPLLVALVLAAGYTWEGARGGSAHCWLGLSGLGALYLVFYTWRHLDANRPAPDAPLYPTLGAANWLTLFRGLALALMLGFFCPRAAVGWGPALLYSFVALTDWWDGFLARSTGHTSRLGELLDLHLDGLGVLIASLLAVAWGRLPWWYALVGLTRYLFLGWERLLGALGRQPRPLKPNPQRRVNAGLMMAFLAVAFYPLFPREGVVLLGLWFFLPFIGGFITDALDVAGIDYSRATIPIVGEVRAAGRLLGAGLLALAVWRSGIAWLGVGVAALLALGVLPRFSALAGLVALGLAWAGGAPMGAVSILASAMLTGIAFYGGGKACLWNPDDRLFETSIAFPPKERVK